MIIFPARVLQQLLTCILIENIGVLKARSFKTTLQISKEAGVWDAKGVLGDLKRIAGRRDIGQIHRRKKVWQNAYIETPPLLKERDQRLRPCLNTKLHLLK